MADKIGIMNDGLCSSTTARTRNSTTTRQPVRRAVRRQPIMNVAARECDAGDGGLRVRLGGMAEPFVLDDRRPGAQVLAAGARRRPGARRRGRGDRAAARPRARPRRAAHLIEPLGAYDIVDVPSARRACACARRAASSVRAGRRGVGRPDAARTQLFDKRSATRCAATAESIHGRRLARPGQQSATARSARCAI